MALWTFGAAVVDANTVRYLNLDNTWLNVEGRQHLSPMQLLQSAFTHIPEISLARKVSPSTIICHTSSAQQA